MTRVWVLGWLWCSLFAELRGCCGEGGVKASAPAVPIQIYVVNGFSGDLHCKPHEDGDPTGLSHAHVLTTRPQLLLGSS